ncbi:MAG: GspE/PulE family protein [Minisyncoccia bacterium]
MTNNRENSDAVQLLDNLIGAAIESRASDIHFEPSHEGFNVRFRIDGILHPIQSLNSIMEDQLVSRIKILSQMDIIEHRLPKDGYFEYSHKDQVYSIRVSTMPEIYGESIVFRIHGIKEVILNIEGLGLDPDQLDLLIKMIKSPNGMILVTGPTGSGKTSLLYSIINYLNSEEKNIMTIEDPIEYRIENVRQTSVNTEVGLTFSTAMRSVLRQDPDILMLGEIRDGETALLGIQASLSGILLLSTFHTFDLPALINRLVEMGVDRSIVAQAIRGVISVRLVRKICDSCKVEITPSEEQLKLLPHELLGSKFYHGTGCEVCKNLGYIGRTGIFEIVDVDSEIRGSIFDAPPSSVVLDLLKKKNAKNLRVAAFNKVKDGVTTIDEALRVTGYLAD